MASLMSSRPTLPPQVIDRLFLRLTAFYGTKLAEAFGGIDMAVMKEIWAEELSGYTLDELNRGVMACRSLKWPPTLPEFMSACRLPITPETAYYEAVNNLALREAKKNPTYSHPAVFWAASEIGTFDMRNVPYKQLAQRWATLLHKHLGDKNIRPVPPPPIELPAPKGKPPSPEIIEQLRGLTEKLKGPLGPSQTGEKQ